MADDFLTESDEAFLATGANPANEAYWRKRLSNQGQFKAPPPRSLWRRFIENFLEEEPKHYGPAPAIARRVTPYVEAYLNRDYDKSMGDTRTISQRREAARQRRVQEERDWREVRAQYDPPDSLGDYAADIAGGIGAAAYGDPTTFIGGVGRNVGEKIINMAGVSAAADLLQQGGEIQEGVRDELNPYQAGINAAAPAVLYPLGVAASKAASRVTRNRGGDSFTLDDARKFGERFGTVTSTVRSKAKNKAVGGVPNSFHLTGQAMDIARGKGVSHKKIETALRRAGFNIIESLDEGDHSHFAFNFKKSRPQEEIVPVGPEDLGDVRLVQDELPIPEEMARINETLLREADDNNVIQFPGEKRAPLTDDELNDILERSLQDNSNPFEGLLTPAEVRDMPVSQRAQMMRELAAPFEAAGPTPQARGALSEDILDSTIGKGRAATTPVNDLREPELPSGIWDDADMADVFREPFTTEELSSMKRLGIPSKGFYKHPDDFEKFWHGTLEEQKAVRKKYSEDLKNDEKTLKNLLTKTLKDIINDEEGAFRPFGRASGPVKPPNPTLSKLNEAVKKAKDATPEQRKAYRAERKKRFAEVIRVQKATSGLTGLKASKVPLKGELPKIDLENIRDQFSPDEVDELINGLTQSRLLSPGERISAGDAIDGLLDGKLPTPSELALISRVYPDLVTSILKKRPLSERAADEFWKLWETWRGAMGSGDVSFSGRQGFMMVSRPEWWKATKDQFKVLLPEMGEARMRNQVERIVNSPHYSRAIEGGLRLMDLGELRGGREEFAPQSYANKIPVLGTVVNASNRAFTYNANELRFSIFSNLLDKWEAKGYDIDDPKLLKDAAKYINIFTGRGSLGKYDRALPLANLVMFAPRFVLSTFQRLNPILSPFTHPAVRKEAVRDAAAFVGVVGTALAGAQQAGYDVEWDPRNPTGLKIRHGKTTYDIGAGMTQTVSLLAKLITNKKTTGKGEEVELDSGDYGSDNAWDIWSRFVRTKLHPSMSYIVDWRVGENVVGEKFNALADAAERFLPMFSTTVAEHLKEHGEAGAPVIPVAGFGVGVQTFEPPERKSKPFSDEDFLRGDFKTSSDKEELSKEDKEFLGL